MESDYFCNIKHNLKNLLFNNLSVLHILYFLSQPWVHTFDHFI